MKGITYIWLLICSVTGAVAQTESTCIDACRTSYEQSPSLAPTTIDSLLQVCAVDSAAKMQMIRYRALANRKKGAYIRAIEDWKSIYAYAKRKGDSLAVAEAADQIGIMNTFMGNLMLGQSYLLEVASIYQHVGTPADRASANNALAILYADLEQYDKAIQKYHEALATYEAVGDTLGRANVHANLGMLYLDLNQLDSAEYHIQVQGYLDTLMQTDWGLGFHYDFMGAVRERQARFQDALRWYRLAYDLRSTLPSQYNLAESSNSMGRIMLLLDQPQNAIEYASEVLDRLEDHQSLNQASTAYLTLSQGYEQLGVLDQALDYYKDYKSVSDSIYRREHLEEISTKQALYEKAEQDRALAKLQLQTVAAEAELKAKTRVLKWAAFSVIASILLLVTLYLTTGKIRRQHEALKKSSKQKDLLMKEIHHRVKNNLQIVSSLLTLQSYSIKDPRVTEALMEGKSRIRSMALIHQDLYGGDEQLGVDVTSYIKKLLAELSMTYRREGLDLKMQHVIDPLHLDIDTVMPMGLIVNELVTNSIKYAFPQGGTGTITVTVQLQDDEHLLLEVADDGVGKGVDSAPQGSNFGSSLVQDLAQQLDGSVEVSTANGRKTSILFKEFKRFT